MNTEQHHQSIIPYLFTACIIFLGGYTELYSIKVNGIFCAMQTGNLLNLFMHLIDEDFNQALLSLIVLLVFLSGCFLAEVYRIHFPGKYRNYYKASVLLFQIVFLIPTLFIPTRLSGFVNEGVINFSNVLQDSFLALYGAFHFISFREEEGHSFTPTMMTNMMKNITVHLAACTKEDKKEHAVMALRYFSLVLSFILGAVTFYFLFRTLKANDMMQYVSYLPGLVIIGNLLLVPFSIYSDRKEQKENH